MYIFGGRSDWAAPRQTDKDKYCSDIYYLDTSRRQWIRPKVFGIKPIARRSHSACMPKLFIKNTIMLLMQVLNWLQLCIMVFFTSSVDLTRTRTYIFKT